MEIMDNENPGVNFGQFITFFKLSLEGLAEISKEDILILELL